MTMKKINLIHNPDAGRKKYSTREVKRLLESNGFECLHASRDLKDSKKWNEGDFIVVAGGDGTVRKLIRQLLKRRVLEGIPPIAILPAGTANNIANTLGISGSLEEIINSWKSGSVKNYDVGKIDGLPHARFFLESFGCGIMPSFMKEIRAKIKKEKLSPEEELALA